MAIYYVKHSGGSDSNDGLSVANAFATLQHACDNVPKNNQIYVMATGTHTPAAPIDLDTQVGTASQPIDIWGADASGNLLTGDNYADISGSAMSSGEDVFRLNQSSGTQYIRMNNLRITAAPQSGISFASSSGQGYVIMKNCRLDNNGFNGIEVGRSGSPNPCSVMAHNCEFDNNTQDGLGNITTNRGEWYLSGCRMHNNGNSGVAVRQTHTIHNCLIYANGAKGVDVGSGLPAQIVSCTIFNNTSDGIDVVHLYPESQVSSNIIASNGGYGYNTNSTGNAGVGHHQSYNLYHNNTSGEHILGDSPIPGINNTIADPDFVSTTEGNAEFLIPSKDSPANGAGANGSDAGSIAHKDPTGSAAVTVGFAI